MSLFEEAMAVAVRLPQAERERLAQALGVQGAPVVRSQSLPLQNFVPRPDSVAWRKAETGHAVLATGGGGASGAQFPDGPGAIFGIWAGRDSGAKSAPGKDWPLASALPKGSPVVAHTDVCIELALGSAAAQSFFEQPGVETRLATATYLTLLGGAENEEQLQRIRRFVHPYAVLSLGPMASSRAVELLLSHTLADGLDPLAALIAATALAHEIPLVALDPQPFANIAGLTVCLPY